MNAPDPKANTTTEAYLAYKAGYLEESELKPKLYEPYLHFDGWLAYWAGLTTTYPVTISKKNLFDINSLSATGITIENSVASGSAQAFNTAFGSSSGGITLSLEEGQYTISIKGYTDGDQATEATSGLGFRIGYSDGTYSNNVYWQNNDLTPVVKTLSTDSKKTPNSLFISFASKGQNIWHLSEIQLEKGSTATEYEPYAVPEMLTDEEALVAYLAGVTDTYPEEIKDPYDVRIVGYLKHLASIRWPEPDYPVNNEEFYLSTMEPTHTSNSEPSADIELDTADGKIISVEAYGDTKQTTYTGKNLFDISKVLSSAQVVNNDDGTLTINTPSGSSTAAAGQPNKLSDYCPNLNVDDIATLSFDTTGSEKYIYLYGTGANFLWGTSTGTHTKTITQAMLDAQVLFYASGSSTTATISNFQIELGSTPTDYEPYVGGVASPNPDYPQDVNVVTGRQQINVSGKNLLDTEYSKVKSVPGNTSSGRTWNDTEKTMEYNGITYKFNEDGTITVSGSTGSSPSFLILNGPIENLQEGSDYYMSGCPAGGNAASYSLRLYTTASTYTPETGNGLAFTYGEQPFIRINISAGIVADDLVFKPMIVNSSDAGDEFVPFQGYESYEINLGKNLLDASTNVEGKRLDASGNLINDGEYFTTDFIKVSPSTEYTYSRYASGGGSTALCTWKADGTFIERIWWGGVNNIPETSFSFTTGPDVGLIKICDIKTISNLQLELGSASSSYAPYSTAIELCKIGDYQDYIYKDGDDWYLHKECGHIQLDANIYGILQDGTAGVNEISYAGAFYVLKGSWNTAGGDYDNDAANARISSNFGEYREQTISGNGAANSMVDGTFCQRSTNDRVYMRFSTLAGKTGNEVKSMLQEQGGTNFYYYLNTPSNTQITDSTLIGQLDALADADTYDSKTYIRVTATDPNLPALLKVEAYKY